MPLSVRLLRLGWHGYVLIPVARSVEHGHEYMPMPPGKGCFETAEWGCQ
jgi:hypothetical protein